MKRRIIALVCLIVVVCTSFTLVACDLKIDAFAKELETPVVTINGEGIARWKAVEHAESYVCNLSGRQIETIYTVVQLNDGETVTVQAVGNGTTYKNSMWSTPRPTQSKAKLAITLTQTETECATSADKI